MQLQFRFFPNIYLCSDVFFLPELILHKYSVEGYVGVHGMLETVQRAENWGVMLALQAFSERC